MAAVATRLARPVKGIRDGVEHHEEGQTASHECQDDQQPCWGCFNTTHSPHRRSTHGSQACQDGEGTQAKATRIGGVVIWHGVPLPFLQGRAWTVRSGYSACGG